MRCFEKLILNTVQRLDASLSLSPPILLIALAVISNYYSRITKSAINSFQILLSCTAAKRYSVQTRQPQVRSSSPLTYVLYAHYKNYDTRLIKQIIVGDSIYLLVRAKQRDKHERTIFCSSNKELRKEKNAMKYCRYSNYRTTN